MTKARLAIALAALLSLAVAANANEDEVNQARAHFSAGTRYYNVGDFAKGLEEFKAAYLAKPDPVFLFNMGQCYRQLGQADGALRQYRAYLRVSPNAPNREAVEEFIALAEQQIKERVANVQPTGVMGSVDLHRDAQKASLGDPGHEGAGSTSVMGSVDLPRDAKKVGPGDPGHEGDGAAQALPAPAVATPAATRGGPERPSKRRLWIGLAVGGGVAVAAAITVALIFSLPKDAAEPSATIPGTAVVTF